VYGLFLWKKIKDAKTYQIYFCFAIFSMLMCTKLFPWRLIPDFLCVIQYPWRMLGEFVFFSSFIIAVNLEYIWQSLKNKKIVRIVFIVITVLIILIELVYSLIHTIQTEDLQRDREYEQLVLDNLNFSVFFINREYLPLVVMDYLEDVALREEGVIDLKGNVEILDENKSGLEMNFSIKEGDAGTVLELPYFNYPGYVVTLEKDETKQVLNQEESRLGLITVVLEEDIQEGKINISYKGTFIEKISYIISFISFIIFLIWIFKQKDVKEKS